MRRMLLCFVLFAGILCVPLLLNQSDEAYAGDAVKAIPPTQGWPYHVVFAHFTNVSPWWTGIAVCNVGNSANQFIVRVCDTSGSNTVHTFDLLGGAKTSGLLENFMPSGNPYNPTSGYIWISGTQDFFATKFTGNADSGGFSEVQQDAEYVAPLP